MIAPNTGEPCRVRAAVFHEFRGPIRVGEIPVNGGLT